VVKPGDIVRVRVLDVDVPRKRISLTLRLDDDAGDREGGSGAQRTAGGRRGDRGDRDGNRGGGKGAAQRGGQRQGRGGPPPGGALADALRRAGLVD
jgi:uncharacterized protein